MAPVKADLRAGNVGTALAHLEERFEGTHDDLVYLMERGLLLRQTGQLDESNLVFERAEQLAEDLYTKSVSLNVASLFTSDAVLPYEGEDFERILLNYFKALNYLDLGQLEGALVECRRAQRKLQFYEERFEGSGDKKYRTDPFVHYLMGLIQESAGELNDAYVSFKKATRGFQEEGTFLGVSLPPQLADELVTVAERLSFHDERDDVQRQFPGAHYRPPPGRGCGEAVVLVEVGFVPVKRDVSLSIPILESEKDESSVTLAGKLRDRAHERRSWSRVHYWLKLAVPSYDPPAAAPWTTVEVGGATASLVENLDALARASLEDRMPRVLLKAIARALAKYLTTTKSEDAVAKKHGDSAGSAVAAILNLAALASEQADLRAWLGLPREIHMARIVLPAGHHEVAVRLRGPGGGILGYETVAVDIREGHTAFVSHRFFL
jgi:hypothetical protein